VEVFLRRGHERAVHALALQPQHHHDVGALQALAHVARHFDAEALDAGRQQGRGRDHAHARAERVEQDDVGARDARMQDVAADRDGEPSIGSLLRRMVSASSSACVGCSCAPSPALTTEPSTFCASSSTAPDA
jgi:hypothetical protein